MMVFSFFLFLLSKGGEGMDGKGISCMLLYSTIPYATLRYATLSVNWFGGLGWVGDVLGNFQKRREGGREGVCAGGREGGREEGREWKGRREGGSEEGSKLSGSGVIRQGKCSAETPCRASPCHAVVSLTTAPFFPT